ncbi:MAG: hypothetical protein M1828_002385 [Chrysothrix sp. TS-e1954]|nr:MAG: hypothetical protein M1828_002385 [Chrysothrix sp. TS-e1954]
MGPLLPSRRLRVMVPHNSRNGASRLSAAAQRIPDHHGYQATPGVFNTPTQPHAMRMGSDWSRLSSPPPLGYHYRHGPASRQACAELEFRDPDSYALMHDFLLPKYAAFRARIWRWLLDLPPPQHAYDAHTVDEQDPVESAEQEQSTLDMDDVSDVQRSPPPRLDLEKAELQKPKRSISFKRRGFESNPKPIYPKIPAAPHFSPSVEDHSSSPTQVANGMASKDGPDLAKLAPIQSPRPLVSHHYTSQGLERGESKQRLLQGQSRKKEVRKTDSLRQTQVCLPTIAEEDNDGLDAPQNIHQSVSKRLPDPPNGPRKTKGIPLRATRQKIARVATLPKRVHLSANMVQPPSRTLQLSIGIRNASPPPTIAPKIEDLGTGVENDGAPQSARMIPLRRFERPSMVQIRHPSSTRSPALQPVEDRRQMASADSTDSEDATAAKEDSARVLKAYEARPAVKKRIVDWQSSVGESEPYSPADPQWHGFATSRRASESETLNAHAVAGAVESYYDDDRRSHGSLTPHDSISEVGLTQTPRSRASSYQSALSRNQPPSNSSPRQALAGARYGSRRVADNGKNQRAVALPKRLLRKIIDKIQRRNRGPYDAGSRSPDLGRRDRHNARVASADNSSFEGMHKVSRSPYSSRNFGSSTFDNRTQSPRPFSRLSDDRLSGRSASITEHPFTPMRKGRSPSINSSFRSQNSGAEYRDSDGNFNDSRTIRDNQKWSNSHDSFRSRSEYQQASVSPRGRVRSINSTSQYNHSPRSFGRSYSPQGYSPRSSYGGTAYQPGPAYANSSIGGREGQGYYNEGFPGSTVPRNLQPGRHTSYMSRSLSPVNSYPRGGINDDTRSFNHLEPSSIQHRSSYPMSDISSPRYADGRSGTRSKLSSGSLERSLATGRSWGDNQADSNRSETDRNDEDWFDDDRSGNDQLSEDQIRNSRLDDDQFDERRLSDDRFSDDQSGNNQIEDDRFSNDRFSDDHFGEDRFSEDRLSEDRCSDNLSSDEYSNSPRRNDSQFSDDQLSDIRSANRGLNVPAMVAGLRSPATATSSDGHHPSSSFEHNGRASQAGSAAIPTHNELSPTQSLRPQSSVIWDYDDASRSSSIKRSRDVMDSGYQSEAATRPTSSAYDADCSSPGNGSEPSRNRNTIASSTYDADRSSSESGNDPSRACKEDEGLRIPDVRHKLQSREIIGAMRPPSGILC